jgi:cytochrome c oxidase assembly factor CtaG
VTPLGRLLGAWDFDPSIVIGCIALLAAYGAAHRRDLARAAWFVAGVALLFLALVSPLDALADTYLFSAHMVQHLILVLAVPPLLLLGLSKRFTRAMLKISAVARIERLLTTPALAWTIGVATLWAWHAPALYNAALADENVHIVEHLCFLMSATIFWWPILAPAAESRMAAMPAIVYLATGALANSVLAILLTFAKPGLYPAYLNPADPLGILRMIRESWELMPAADQQLGGLIMWVPGGFVFLCAIVGVIARWYGEGEPELEAAHAN